VLQAQSRRAVGLLPYVAVDQGPAAIGRHLAALAADGIALVIADTLAERHLAALAEASLDAPLLTGNSSVAAHLPPLWLARGLMTGPTPVELPAVEGPGAVLAGSVAQQTLLQLDHLAGHAPVLTLDLARSVAGADLAGEAVAFARKAIAAGRDFAVSTAVPQAEVERLQARIGRSEVAACAEKLLSDIARRLVEELSVRRLIVAGGETSGAVMAALGIDQIAVGPYQGLGMSRGIARNPNPLALVLKSGKLGPVDVFSAMLEAMRKPLLEAPQLTDWPPVCRAADAR
jgi:uncharacterized protein YgbK (DUF1537 family)